MKNMILFETDFNYKVFERERKIMKVTTNEITNKKTVIAVKLERKIDGAYVIDPLTNSFLKDELWSNNTALNTQKKYMRTICSFLNYCRYMVSRDETEFADLKDGLFKMKFRHACLFLQDQVARVESGEIKPNTVGEMEYPLLRFYQYLLDCGVINENVNKILEIERKKNKIKTIHNPFRQIGTYYVPFPKNEMVFQSVRDFTDDSFEDRLENIRLMINLARNYYKDIAFALCLMFYGGLRLGEVVNMTRSNLIRPVFYDDDDTGEDGFVVHVEDNPELFAGKKTKSNNQVKRRTKFAALEVIDIPLVSDVYKDHKLHIKYLEREKKINNNFAFFYSTHKGVPLTYNAAYYQFKKLGEIFIETLVENGDKKTLENLTDVDTNDFKMTPHLCRAVFTNLGIDLGYTKEQMKNRRGDLSPHALEAYWNRKIVKKKRQEVVSTMQDEAIKSYRSRKET
ncbi:site-specific integrase [Bacillus sp. ISL-35]|uniref:hypothetical protein n=1 Tax=Bacillus sp. ISL-35 TaxID=2819122 RepID=UPI001BE9B6F2|nr:hypothetical protein [Bacillus sp. ISL-35]MBT2677373.1 site-specific integrase [Bacillus sp. ISL-35]MBT2702240.1 site-specific integrase [Chryseobacterium sp. ISL-80]